MELKYLGFASPVMLWVVGGIQEAVGHDLFTELKRFRDGLFRKAVVKLRMFSPAGERWSAKGCHRAGSSCLRYANAQHFLPRVSGLSILTPALRGIS